MGLNLPGNFLFSAVIIQSPRFALIGNVAKPQCSKNMKVCDKIQLVWYKYIIYSGHMCHPNVQMCQCTYYSILIHAVKFSLCLKHFRKGHLYYVFSFFLRYWFCCCCINSLPLMVAEVLLLLILTHFMHTLIRYKVHKNEQIRTHLLCIFNFFSFLWMPNGAYVLFFVRRIFFWITIRGNKAQWRMKQKIKLIFIVATCWAVANTSILYDYWVFCTKLTYSTSSD